MGLRDKLRAREERRAAERVAAMKLAKALERKQQQSTGLLPTQKTGKRLAELDGLVVFEKRLRSPLNGKHFTVTADTRVEVTTSGNVAAVRGRNLGAKAAAHMVVPVVGAFLVGNARTQVIDGRNLNLVIEDPGWDLVIPCHPDRETEVRSIAAVIRRAAANRGRERAGGT